MILLTILLTIAITPERIKYQDRPYPVEAKCLLNCSENGNVIACDLPDNKSLKVTKQIYYDSSIVRVK
jgi:hypothetical protein